MCSINVSHFLGYCFFFNKGKLFLQWFFTMDTPQRRPSNLESAKESTPLISGNAEETQGSPKPRRTDFGVKPAILVTIPKRKLSLQSGFQVQAGRHIHGKGPVLVLKATPTCRPVPTSLEPTTMSAKGRGHM